MSPSLALFISLLAGAPQPASTVSPQSELQAALADVATVRLEDAVFTRYLTLYASPDQQNDWRVLAFWVNSLSSARKLVPPQMITGTLYRVDLRNYNWDIASWDAVAKTDPYFRFANNGLIVRGDWFITQTSDGTRSQAYYQLLYGVGKEPKNADEFRKRWAVDLNLARGQKATSRVPVETGASIVAHHNRLLEHARTVLGDYWQTFDVINDSADRNLIETLDGKFRFDAGEHIVSLPNSLHGYLLTNAQGARIEFADPAVAKDITAHLRPTVDNPISCLRCHGPQSGLQPPKNRLEELLKNGAFVISNNQQLQQDLEAFYLTEDGQAMRDGQRSYAKAVAQINGLTGKQNANKMADLVRFYDSLVSLDQACLELGTTKELLTAAVTKTVLLAKDDRNGQLVALVRVGSVSRNIWETAVFKKAQALLIVAGPAK